MIKKNLPNWLIIVILLVLIFRIPTLFMPYSYGDETIYLTLGEGIRQNLVLYKDIHDNKPPLIYIVAAIVVNLTYFKLFLAIWNIATIIVFWNLANKLFASKESVPKVATIIFAILTNLPLLEGNIVNSEILMIGPITLSFLILLSSKPTTKNLIISGIIFSIAVLFKLPAIFDLPAIIFFWLLISKKIDIHNLKVIFKRTFFFCLGVSLPIILTFVWYAARGALFDYVKAAFLENIGYLSSWNPSSKTQPFLVKNGPLLIRAAIVFLGLSIIYTFRKKIPKNFAFASGWLLLSLFGATLSGRPYPHYLVQAIPSISILLAILFSGEGLVQSLTIIPLTLAFFVPVYFKFWYYPSLPFYINFINFVTNKITKDEYINNFNKNMARNYALAQFIKITTSKNERVFVWGDDAKIYALSKRLPPIKYIADYHIKDFSNKSVVAKQIIEARPKIVIFLSESEPFLELEDWLKKNYLKIQIPKVEHTTRIYVLPSSKVASL
ncbi:MAG: hypothetical protein KatS3mg088_162 [Patescibacteria group bacterium]|nr:MAG: hypothetical protein KatS3mg088_162 [Patescibacteria group bacterium]